MARSERHTIVCGLGAPDATPQRPATRRGHTHHPATGTQQTTSHPADTLNPWTHPTSTPSPPPHDTAPEPATNTDAAATTPRGGWPTEISPARSWRCRASRRRQPPCGAPSSTHRRLKCADVPWLTRQRETLAPCEGFVCHHRAEVTLDTPEHLKMEADRHQPYRPGETR